MDALRNLLNLYQTVIEAETTYGHRRGNGALAAIGLRTANAHFRIIEPRYKPHTQQGMRFRLHVPVGGSHMGRTRIA